MQYLESSPWLENSNEHKCEANVTIIVLSLRSHLTCEFPKAPRKGCGLGDLLAPPCEMSLTHLSLWWTFLKPRTPHCHLKPVTLLPSQVLCCHPPSLALAPAQYPGLTPLTSPVTAVRSSPLQGKAPENKNLTTLQFWTFKSKIWRPHWFDLW